MYKQLALKMIGLTEQQILEEVEKYNLTLKEIEVLNKGKDFVEKASDIKNEDSAKRVLLSLAAYMITQERGSK